MLLTLAIAPSILLRLQRIGVVFDSGLKFEKQVNAVVKSSFFHLRRVAKLKSLFSTKRFEQIIHLFILSRLDYCNALYYGISQSCLKRLQAVQNAAARQKVRSCHAHFNLFKIL